MHKKRIVHRDLKPENILLNSECHLKITDFGESKIISQEEEKTEASFVGTALYISPEMLTDNVAAPASDLWALGCIIYQMRFGTTPFHANVEGMIMTNIT